MAPTIRDLLPTIPVESDATPRVVGIEEEAADEVFDALGSETARTLFAELTDEPRTPADLVAHVETSLQNVHHHLDRLEKAGLITPVGTTYSEKGVEMTIYGTTDAPLVVTNADDAQRSLLRTALRRLFVGLGVLILLSVTVQGVSNVLTPTSRPTPPPGMSASTSFVPPPGLVVFVVGLPVVVALAVWLAYRETD